MVTPISDSLRRRFRRAAAPTLLTMSRPESVPPRYSRGRAPGRGDFVSVSNVIAQFVDPRRRAAATRRARARLRIVAVRPSDRPRQMKRATVGSFTKPEDQSANRHRSHTVSKAPIPDTWGFERRDDHRARHEASIKVINAASPRLLDLNTKRDAFDAQSDHVTRFGDVSRATCRGYSHTPTSESARQETKPDRSPYSLPWRSSSRLSSVRDVRHCVNSAFVDARTFLHGQR